ncbi:integral membrane PTH11 [Fusarium albosuccineum]|uniref:Integral membrane PTH11 n=1 Tax=Fusarium albosuccineum TaxID=1237068 RepID=A0A8H4LRC0_9HYPO|nr:integral membrane PTH11 [Fusarium albosuccineum]
MAAINYVTEPPEGRVRTTVNPPTSAHEVISAGIATTVIALIAVCLRLFTRKYVVKGVLGADDYLCITGLVFSFIFLGVTLTLLNLGAGNHIWDIPMEEYSPKFWQTTVASTLVYGVCIGLAKLSVLAFYLRISPDRLIRRAVHTLLGLVCIYTLLFCLLTVFRCRPVAAGWDLSIEGEECLDKIIPMLTLAIANILIDVCVLCLPIRIVLPLQIPLPQKISLGLLFATGGFVCVASIKRTVITYPLQHSTDYPWEVPRQLIWSFIEINAGFICASVPALKPFCMRYIPFLIHSRLRSQEKPSKSRFSISQDKRRQSRNPYSGSYELPSREEFGGAGNPQDDEARLWTVAGDKNAALDSVDTKQDTDSLESLADKAPAPPAVPEPALVGFTTKRSANIGGIQVTKETVITYGPTS